MQTYKELIYKLVSYYSDTTEYNTAENVCLEEDSNSHLQAPKPSQRGLVKNLNS
jgi:hypothetical protein